MRKTTEEEQSKMRMHRFIIELERRKLLGELCVFCGNPIETMHHKDEDHTNNRKNNLISFCKQCHLNLQHNLDTEDYVMAESVIKKSSLTWLPALYMPQNRTKMPRKSILSPQNAQLGKVNRDSFGIIFHKLKSNLYIRVIYGCSLHLREVLKGLGYEQILQFNES